MRAPDAAWVERERLSALTSDQRHRFLPLCPDFVIELRSPSDPLPSLEAKMHEYLANGARLAWLIDPQGRRVTIYRRDSDVEILDQPASVAGDPELPGFVLKLAEIWNPSW